MNIQRKITIFFLALGILTLSPGGAWTQEKSITQESKSKRLTNQEQIISIQVTENGFEPSSIDAKPNLPLTLKVTRKTESTCATQIKMKSQKILKNLPLNKTVTLPLGKLQKGELEFSCGMDMIKGKIKIQ